MKSLSLSRPHVIFMVGLPGSGKTFFAQQFAETFHAPYLDTRAIALYAGSAENADIIAEGFAKEIVKTGQTFVFEGTMDTRVKRTEFAKWARSKGYQPLLVWVQTDNKTAMQRSLKNYDMTREEYEKLIRNFSAPHPSESPVVLSGKHTYATQAKVILSRLSSAGERHTTSLTTPPRTDSDPQKPSRKSILIR